MRKKRKQKHKNHCYESWFFKVEEYKTVEDFRQDLSEALKKTSKYINSFDEDYNEVWVKYWEALDVLQKMKDKMEYMKEKYKEVIPPEEDKKNVVPERKVVLE